MSDIVLKVLKCPFCGGTLPNGDEIKKCGFCGKDLVTIDIAKVEQIINVSSCPNCGGRLYFDSKSNEHVCEYCSSRFKPGGNFEFDNASENAVLESKGCIRWQSGFNMPGRIMLTNKNLTFISPYFKNKSKCSFALNDVQRIKIQYGLFAGIINSTLAFIFSTKNNEEFKLSPPKNREREFYFKIIETIKAIPKNNLIDYPKEINI